MAFSIRGLVHLFISMGQIILTVCFFSPSLAYGYSLVAASKATKYISTHKKCELAIGFFNPGEQRNSKDPKILSSVYCIADATLNKGTIHETSGCMFLMLNMDTGGLETPLLHVMLPRNEVAQAKAKQACSSGGFEELMKMKLRFEDKPTVRKMIAMGPIIGKGIDTIYLFSTSDSYKSTYENAKKEFGHR
jgi:hypothetical protein